MNTGWTVAEHLPQKPHQCSLGCLLTLSAEGDDVLPNEFGRYHSLDVCPTTDGSHMVIVICNQKRTKRKRLEIFKQISDGEIQMSVFIDNCKRGWILQCKSYHFQENIPSINYLYRLSYVGLLVTISSSHREARYILDRSPVHRRAIQRHT